MSPLQAIIDWPTAAAVVAVAAPLVAVPLTIVTFYLKALREHQVSRQDELARRIEALDASAGAARQALVEVQRDYTTKEEWLRENMAARHHLERLLAAVTRLETEIDVVRGFAPPAPPRRKTRRTEPRRSRIDRSSADGERTIQP